MPKFSEDHLIEQYRIMQRIRRFEEEAARAYAQGKVGGFLHLYIGQEAIAAGINAALTPDDYVFQTYRDHGIALARGMDSRSAMAELFGKHEGCSRGLGGSMHFFDVERNFLGGWAVIGGHIALAAGAAFKSKYSGDGRVTVCMFGEGSTNIGGFHEGLSLAGLWKLPVIFICENNQYAMGTPMERTTPLSDLSIKAQGYGMVGDRFRGHDATFVEERIRGAVDRARGGGGPTFIEIETYRFRGHSMSDPAKYRTREELEDRKKADPLRVLREIFQNKGFDLVKLDEVDDQIEEEIEDAIRFANEAEPAREESVWNTVYAPNDNDSDSQGGSNA